MDCTYHDDSFQDREGQIQVRYDQVKKDGEKIHALVKEVYTTVAVTRQAPLSSPFSLPQNLDYFKATEDSEMWQHYLDYLDDIMVDGLFNCIHCSLQYLLQNTDKTAGSMIPLLEVKLELQVQCTQHISQLGAVLEFESISSYCF